MRGIVIGIGNILRADDGVGVHAIQKLKERKPDIEAVDLATAGIEILGFIRGREKAVIIDATKTGAEPGTIHRITLERLMLSEYASSHGVNLPEMLLLGGKLYPDEMPREVVILAVEAEDIDSFSTELTSKVKSAIPKLIDLIEKELEDNKS